MVSEHRDVVSEKGRRIDRGRRLRGRNDGRKVLSVVVRAGDEVHVQEELNLGCLRARMLFKNNNVPSTMDRLLTEAVFVTGRVTALQRPPYPCYCEVLDAASGLVISRIVQIRLIRCL